MKKRTFKSFAAIAAAFLLTLGLSAVPVHAEETFQELTPGKAADAAEAESVLLDNAAYASGTISRTTTDNGSTVVENTDQYFNFTLPEDGIVYIRYTMSEGSDSKFLGGNFTLYRNEELTNTVYKAVELTKTEEKIVSTYLKKGNYYVNCQAETAFADCKGTNSVGVSVAYVPVKGKTTDFTVSHSTKSTTTSNVVLKVETADPDAKVWIMEDVSEDYLLDNNIHWTDDYLSENNQYTVKKNGKYTIRIQDSLGNYSQKVATVSNIDRIKPATPAVSSAKAGLKSITGTADAGTIVYIKVGSVTKAVTARDNDSFSLSVSSLKAGTKITVYAKDYAGNKSQSKTYTVK